MSAEILTTVLSTVCILLSFAGAVLWLTSHFDARLDRLGDKLCARIDEVDEKLSARIDRVGRL